MIGIPGHSDTVLIVDDEPDTLRMLTAALETAEISVLVATSGHVALAQLGNIMPDLILMDAVMPGMDGFETTQKIKANPQLASIPIIFMTGLTESEHVVEAFEVGGVDYVRKPVDLQELLARVRVHMAQGRAVHASVASLDATDRLILATDARGSLLWCTPRAEQAISRVSPGWLRSESALPEEIRNQIEKLLTKDEGVAGNAVRVRQTKGQGELEMQVIAHYREDEVLIRLNELNPEQDLDRLQERLPLTRREAEVLLWVSYGKPNRVISDVLEISPRTVTKHLERIFDKLGVETRSAAAAVAIRMLGQ
ncbi:DNA-binding NarL/FixJ family response regulator [Sphingobium sp. B2D3A]|uniref:response regulator transcription factor n=1 Tax=Sphingobium TaxID=165695 RepID=UPI0015EB44B4|nr:MULTISPECIES: DNA-binding response regulator [Sphingobium]MCW2336952.1 DNA-binding NarL/FixJ family response regulator [Sphingobium sp. B2D3A]MCW2351354.1 DNA-binding NarL/FixJ family response regulator [Sphingobium sp. B12D2B]MCW2362819.1 DNA-binding NarL/FixJ family response regulator [Sphingobium sp. B10D3B]MCW2365345.1 DNA-binding NarL/FixJ family response regulator [Sphingobium sp. B7D2B]MCW2370576.1 DNA-binding NarL/FixJ family response regulator [Sphingobium sp. B11D3D]